MYVYRLDFEKPLLAGTSFRPRPHAGTLESSSSVLAVD